MAFKLRKKVQKCKFQFSCSIQIVSNVWVPAGRAIPNAPYLRMLPNKFMVYWELDQIYDLSGAFFPTVKLLNTKIVANGIHS